LDGGGDIANRPLKFFDPRHEPVTLGGEIPQRVVHARTLALACRRGWSRNGHLRTIERGRCHCPFRNSRELHAAVCAHHHCDRERRG
jgi:hypothetical protein